MSNCWPLVLVEIVKMLKFLLDQCVEIILRNCKTILLTQFRSKLTHIWNGPWFRQILFLSNDWPLARKSKQSLNVVEIFANKLRKSEPTNFQLLSRETLFFWIPPFIRRKNGTHENAIRESNAFPAVDSLGPTYTFDIWCPITILLFADSAVSQWQFLRYARHKVECPYRCNIRRCRRGPVRPGVPPSTRSSRNERARRNFSLTLYFPRHRSSIFASLSDLSSVIPLVLSRGR